MSRRVQDRTSAGKSGVQGAFDRRGPRTTLQPPYFVAKLQSGEALTQPDYPTLYTPGPVGYTDYPA